MRASRAFGAVCIALYTLLQCGCVTSAVEQSIRDLLSQKVGKADYYHVQILHTSNKELATGHIREMVVEGANIAGPVGPAVEKVRAHILDLQADPAARAFKSARQADVHFTFREQDLQRYMRAKNQDLAEARLAILDDKALLKLNDFPMNHQPLRISGTVAVDQEQNVNFVAQDAFLGARTMDEQTLTLMLYQINPLINLAKLPITLKVNAVTCTPGMVEVSTTITDIKAAAWPQVIKIMK